MKKFYTILILAFGLSFISLSQTISTATVFWTTGWCNICGPVTGNYACAAGSGSPMWNNGVATFVDPSPVGHSICAVQVVVNKVDCGLTNLCVLLNGITVQCLPVGVGTDCGCGNCWPQTFTKSQCPFPSYVKNGVNTLDLNETGNLCVNNCVITVFSNPNCSGPCVLPLSIELSSFEANCKGKNIQLDWTTATESNNNYFIIERGTNVNNTIDWKVIGKTAGGGNSKLSTSYGYTDELMNENFKSGSTFYYRLKSVNYDGSFEYSKLISSKCHYKYNEINLYPIPATDELVIEGIDKSCTIQITDFTQKVMKEWISSDNNKQTINISSLEKGIYFLVIKTGAKSTFLKFNKD